MFKELKGKECQLPSQCFIKENKNTETQFFWGGGGGRIIIREFSLFAGWGMALEPTPHKKVYPRHAHTADTGYSVATYRSGYSYLSPPLVEILGLK